MAEKKTGCTVGVPEVKGDPGIRIEKEESVKHKEESRMSIMVGRKAPDFTAPAYRNGEFTQVNLSEHLGKWVLLCFYPGDFTFV